MSCLDFEDYYMRISDYATMAMLCKHDIVYKNDNKRILVDELYETMYKAHELMNSWNCYSEDKRRCMWIQTVCAKILDYLKD